MISVDEHGCVFQKGKVVYCPKIRHGALECGCSFWKSHKATASDLARIVAMSIAEEIPGTQYQVKEDASEEEAVVILDHQDGSPVEVSVSFDPSYNGDPTICVRDAFTKELFEELVTHDMYLAVAYGVEGVLYLQALAS